MSNYGVHHLDELEAYIKELEGQNGKGKGGEISVGQWELHPWLGRQDIVEWCQKRGVVLEAYCPIVRGGRSNDPLLKPLVGKYGKTPAQVLLRWSLQKVGSLSGRASDVHMLTGDARVLFHCRSPSQSRGLRRMRMSMTLSLRLKT